MRIRDICCIRQVCPGLCIYIEKKAKEQNEIRDRKGTVDFFI